MTAKQKANQARFKAVIAEAKKLRKKNPSLNQAQAVKQAWAIMYGKKSGGKKVGETHKDTKSHNVNIRVVSGVKKKSYKREFQIVRQKDKKKITILSVDGKDPLGRPFNRDEKIKGFKYLGYEVLDMKGKKIAGWRKGKTKFVEKGEKKPKSRSFRVNRSEGRFKSFKSIISGIGDIGQHFTRIKNDLNGNPRYVVHFIELLNDEERLTLPFNEKYNYAVKKAKKIGGKRYHNKSYGGGIVFQSYNIDDTWKSIQRIKESSIPW